jgi:hypothetical protein
MGNLSDIVAVSIIAETAKLSQAGFGIPLVTSFTAAWAERTRTYATLAELGVDFATTTPEYKAAAKIFGQSPTVTSVMVGRCALPPTQRYRLTPTAVNGYTYRWKVNGTAQSYTADSATSATEIIAGVKAAIDGLSLALTTSDQTTYLRALANNAGDWFYFESSDPNLQLMQDHADPGIATDLAAILVESQAWYALVTTFNSKALVDAAAAWAQSNSKLYLAQTVDAVVPNTISSGTDDVGESTAGSAIDHCPIIFSKATDDFADAAWLGKCLPFRPGTESWKFKTLANVSAGSYTSTQRTNMRAKKVNFYEATAGVNITEEGYASSGKYIDFVRYLDFLKARIGERIYGKLAALKKMPFTDEGIQVVKAEIEAQLQEDETFKALAPGWTVTVPKAANVSALNKAARLLPDVQFNATYAGAIHKVEIEGTVSL